MPILHVTGPYAAVWFSACGRGLSGRLCLETLFRFLGVHLASYLFLWMSIRIGRFSRTRGHWWNTRDDKSTWRLFQAYKFRVHWYHYHRKLAWWQEPMKNSDLAVRSLYSTFSDHDISFQWKKREKERNRLCASGSFLYIVHLLVMGLPTSQAFIRICSI